MKIRLRERNGGFRFVRRKSGAGTGILILAGFLFSVSSAAVAALASLSANENSCALLISPEHPAPGATLRILAAGSEDLNSAEIVVSGPSGRVRSLSSRSGGGPPYWRCAEVKAGAEGIFVVSVAGRKKLLISREITVSASKPRQNSASVWINEREWGRDTEDLYSAWIDSLFHDADERSSWPALHAVTQDPRRNVLYNRLGLGEDDPASKNPVVMEPDCADNPFFLRAYFSWKLGLPFGFHECDRGWVGRAPRTGRWITNASRPKRTNPVQAFNAFLREVMNAVHSGTARTKLEDDTSDYYPLPLTREALRPGTVFADPYGHTLVIIRWRPQTDDQSGRLLAVDAQPDGTVAVKRFWGGNFLFTTSEIIGEPGFKAFRPVHIESGRSRALRNAEIASSPDYGNFSLQQKNMGSTVFYGHLERLINPRPLDPESALRELFTALHEQLLVRVQSVANGEAYVKAHPGTVIPMPSTAAGVFQTGGLWEDFSTPNRDLRLLIAMDMVLDFPAKVAGSPGSYKFPKRKSPQDMKIRLEEIQGKWSREMAISYIRSDGKEQNLTLAEILKRRDAFEMGYNPNDGIEIRWGAPEGSVEHSSCRRRAPTAQQKKMEALRTWFRKRLHPPT